MAAPRKSAAAKRTTSRQAAARPAGARAPQDRKAPTPLLTGDQKVRVGGRTRTLRFDGRALYQAHTDFEISDVQQAIARIQVIDFTTMVQLLFVGVQADLRDDEEIEFDDVLDWVGGGRGQVRLGELVQPLILALTAAITDEGAIAEALDKARPTRRGRGTGAALSTPDSQQD